MLYCWYPLFNDAMWYTDVGMTLFVNLFLTLKIYTNLFGGITKHYAHSVFNMKYLFRIV